MLFLPQSVNDARVDLWQKVEAGEITEAQAFPKLLEINPDDHVAMVGLGRLRSEAGDMAGAEEYFWRALQLQPCWSLPYLELSHVMPGRESAYLADALREIGFSKHWLSDDAQTEPVDLAAAGFKGKALAVFGDLSSPEQNRMLALTMRAELERNEPAEVTARMRHLRLLQKMQEEIELDRAAVDAILEAGESMELLLIGVLRGWAQEIPGGPDDDTLENALALLGEIGSAARISEVLEFVEGEFEAAAGPAKWALGRIMERYPAESASRIESLCPGLASGGRLEIAEQILRHPGFDPAGNVLEILGGNLEGMANEERDTFFVLLLGVMAAAGGKAGVRLARKVHLRQQGLLSRSGRRKCEEFLNLFEQQGLPPTELQPSSLTIYQICAGDAVWEEEDGGEDGPDDEFELVAEPVRRPVTPGRNDPCWCGSGKKYKKCHLDSDHQAAHNPTSAAEGSNEFVGLRKSIGDFMAEVLSGRDFKLATSTLFGDEPPGMDDKGAQMSLVDWIVHDWPAPGLRRTVMEEFLARRGTRLSEREREIVQAWSRSFISLYEVQEPRPGEGLLVRDMLLGGEPFFVHDVSMSTRLVRWDGLLTRVVPAERGLEFAGSGLSVPRHHLEAFRKWVEKDRKKAGVEWPEYLKKNWPRLRHESFAIVEDAMKSLRLQNTDGEELLFSKALYKVLDAPALLRALRACPELDENEAAEKPDGGPFVWLNEKKTVLGNLRISGSELTLDANSRQRLVRGKHLLAGLAGNSLRHLRDEHTTQKELKRRAAESRETPLPEPSMPKHVRDEVAGRFLAEHYAKWPDEKLPALAGKTPSQAVKTAGGRLQVIDLLKLIENGEEHKRLRGDPFYDVELLRSELGLD